MGTRCIIRSRLELAPRYCYGHQAPHEVNPKYLLAMDFDCRYYNRIRVLPI